MRTFSALLLAAVAAMPAHAEIVKYAFTATVDIIVAQPAGTLFGQSVGSSNLAGPTIAVGDTWTGFLFYDTDLALSEWQPAQPPATILKAYTGYLASTIFSADHALLFDSQPGGVTAPAMFVADSQDPLYGDSVTIFTHAADGNVESGGFAFVGGTSALANAAPPAGLALDTFDSSTVSYTFNGPGGSLGAAATITSLVPTDALPPVPEPATYAMLGLGLAALAMTKRFTRT